MGTSDWLWAVLGWGVAALGVALLAWALWWDRSRGRRRCPKCWYDMVGVSGLVCPECGRRVRRERALHRSRRRLSWAALAVSIVVAGAAATRVPVVRHRGWIAAVPAPALRMIMRPFASQAQVAYRDFERRSPEGPWNRLSSLGTPMRCCCGGSVYCRTRPISTSATKRSMRHGHFPECQSKPAWRPGRFDRSSHNTLTYPARSYSSTWLPSSPSSVRPLCRTFGNTSHTPSPSLVDGRSC